MLKRIVLAIVLVALTVPVGAQQYVVNLQLTVGASGVGFSSATSPTCTSNSCLLAQDGHLQANYASCSLTPSSGTIAYRIDGTAATTGSVGMQVSGGGSFVIQGNQNLINFSAIRTGSTSGDVRCVLSN